MSEHETKVAAPHSYIRQSFIECPACRVKPGSPDLCVECLERRELFGRAKTIYPRAEYERQVKALHEGLEVSRQLIRKKDEEIEALKLDLEKANQQVKELEAEVQHLRAGAYSLNQQKQLLQVAEQTPHCTGTLVHDHPVAREKNPPGGRQVRVQEITGYDPLGQLASKLGPSDSPWALLGRMTQDQQTAEFMRRTKVAGAKLIARCDRCARAVDATLVGQDCSAFGCTHGTYRASLEVVP